MAYAMEGATAGTAARGASLTGVISDFDSITHRLLKSVQLLSVIGDRIEGTRPQDATQAKVDTPPHSVIDDLQRKRDHMLRLCEQIEESASRIDRAFGGGPMDGAKIAGVGR